METILLSSLMWACFWRIVYGIRHKNDLPISIKDELVAFIVTFTLVVIFTSLILMIVPIFKYLNAV